jgi:glycosyltransferase involved in cell wall biosynthesis
MKPAPVPRAGEDDTRVWLLTFERMPNPEAGGPWVRLGWLSRSLGQEGADLHLFSRGERPRARRLERLWDARHTRLPGLGASPAPRLTGMMLLATPYLVWRALKERPQVVVAHSCIYGPLMALLRLVPAARRPRLWLDVPWITSVEIEQSYDPPWLRRLRQRVWRVLERIAVASADLITTATQLMQDLIDPAGSNRSKMRMLRNAGSVLPPINRDPDFLASLGIEETDTVCLFVGVLTSNRLRPLLQAFPRAVEREPALKLVIAGVGPDLETYRRLAGERTFLVGFRSGGDLEQLLARADITFSDCWHDDGFPLKIFQYMGAGKASLIEGKPQLSEVLTDGKTAAFYNGERELADKLVALARDPQLRASLGESARQLLIQEHTWSARSDRLRDLLAELGF